MSKNTTTTTADVVNEALTKIRESAAASQVHKQESVNWTPKKIAGSAARQGDVYLLTIPADWLKSQEGVAFPEGAAERQIAEGNTQGSRHIISGDCKIFRKHNIGWAKINNLLKQNPGVQITETIGPAFITGKGCSVTHPEHGDIVVPEGYAIITTYQQTWQDVARRVQD